MTKTEYSNNERNPNDEIRNHAARRGALSSGLRHSFVLRRSSFVTDRCRHHRCPSMNFNVSATLESEIDELLARYPHKRSASLMLLHAVQEHFGWISRDAMEWIARKVELQPINIYELVTFYPMFRQEPA